MNQDIPGYVYRENISDSCLVQGDILKVDGKFRQYFNEFYPVINHNDNKDRFVMILTQSCDLVKNGKRKPKLNHINVCLVRSLKSAIQRIIENEIKPFKIGVKNLLARDALDKLKDRLSKLLNNTDQKIHFYLPKYKPFTEDMVAIVPLSFSFRIDHYDLMLKHRVLGVKPEFQAKLGHIISQLYGRIGTSDLNDQNWSDKETRNYIKELLYDSNLVQVPDESYIHHIMNKGKDSIGDLEESIQECQAMKNQTTFGPLKNELIQNIKTRLLRIFDDKNKVDNLTKLAKPELSKEIVKILNA